MKFILNENFILEETKYVLEEKYYLAEAIEPKKTIKQLKDIKSKLAKNLESILARLDLNANGDIPKDEIDQNNQLLQEISGNNGLIDQMIVKLESLNNEQLGLKSLDSLSEIIPSISGIENVHIDQWTKFAQILRSCIQDITNYGAKKHASPSKDTSWKALFVEADRKGYTIYNGKTISIESLWDKWAESFTKVYLKSDPKLKTVLDSLQRPIIEECMELGFDRKNPFLDYLVRLLTKYDIYPLPDSYAAIHNAFANTKHFLRQQDLAAGNEKLSPLLYNESFFKQDGPDCFELLVAQWNIKNVTANSEKDTEEYLNKILFDNNKVRPVPEVQTLFEQEFGEGTYESDKTKIAFDLGKIEGIKDPDDVKEIAKYLLLKYLDDDIKKLNSASIKFGLYTDEKGKMQINMQRIANVLPSLAIMDINEKNIINIIKELYDKAGLAYEGKEEEPNENKSPEEK